MSKRTGLHTIDFGDALKAQLSDEARLDGRSLGGYIRHLVETHPARSASAAFREAAMREYKEGWLGPAEDLRHAALPKKKKRAT